MIRSAPKIYSPPKEIKKKQIPKFVIIIIILLIIVLILVILSWYFKIFQIKSIDTSSNIPTDAQSYLNNYLNQNIFTVNSNTIAFDLQNKYPEYSSIEVYKGLPNILKVRFNERSPVHILRSNNTDYLVDNNGIAFKIVDSASRPDLIIVSDNKNIIVNIPTQVTTENFINFITSAKMKLSGIGLETKEFQINDSIFQIDTLTNQGPVVKFDITRSISDQIDAVSQVYPKDKDLIKQYIDVRVPGKVYYQ